MSQNKTSLDKEYAKLVIKLKQLELIKEELTKRMIDRMNDQGITNDSNEFGSCVLAWRKTWEYSDKTQHLEVQLKEAKKREENSGAALVKQQTEYLRFIPKKLGAKD